MRRNEMPPADEAPVACNLGAAGLVDRVESWRRLLARVETVERPHPGVAVMRLSPQVPAGELALLCAQEVECCPFFAFALHLDSSGMSLTVRVPEDVRSTLDSLVELLPPGARTAAP